MQQKINLNSVPPGQPYTKEFPSQTAAAAFQAGGEQAFAEDWYWSSTQHASDSGCAWCQYFGNGNQYYSYASNSLRARAVRRLAI